MNLSISLHILFYIVFYGVGIWMIIIHLHYHKVLREINKRTDTTFGDLLYGSRVTTEESRKFYRDLFSRDIKNPELRKTIQNIRLSYAIVIIVIFAGIIIFNIF